MSKKSKAIVEALEDIKTTKGSFSLYRDVVVETLDVELTNITELFAFWAIESENMQAKYLQKEVELKRLRARLDLRIRRKITKGEIEKLAEAGINNKIILDEEYIKLEEEGSNLKTLYNKLNVARQAMAMKKDVLQSIAANRRRELDERALTIKSKTRREE